MNNNKIFKKYYCINCDKEISWNKTRCKKCWYKFNTKYTIRKSLLKKKYLKENKTFNIIAKELKVSEWAVRDRLIKYSIPFKSRNEVMKNSYKTGRRKKIKLTIEAKKRMMKGMNRKATKPEIIIRILLYVLFPKQYKYVGNGKIWIDGFNPDFININGQKKIIEVYGDYWHNTPERKERDKERLKTYNKYGYKTLVIWEHELKDTNKIKDRLLKFHY